MVSLNELRAGPRFKKGIQAAEGTCSDGEIYPTPPLSLSLFFFLPPPPPPPPPISSLCLHPPNHINLVHCSGFMLNFCAVLLHLCKPFFANHTSGEKLGLINGDYPTSSLCRLDLNNETCFVGGIINSKRDLSSVFVCDSES